MHSTPSLESLSDAPVSLPGLDMGSPSLQIYICDRQIIFLLYMCYKVMEEAIFHSQYSHLERRKNRGHKTASGPSVLFSSVQSLSHIWLTLCDPMDCSMPGLPVHHQLLEFIQLMSIESVMPSNHLILCRPLLLPSIFPSIMVFSNESALCIRWPKYWSFSFNISPSNEYSGLISFRVYWLDLFAVQGTLKSLPQHHSSKASILRGSAFFIVQLTSIHDYWKNHSLD